MDLPHNVGHEAATPTAVAQQQAAGRLRLAEEGRRGYVRVGEAQVVVKIVDDSSIHTARHDDTSRPSRRVSELNRRQSADSLRESELIQNFYAWFTSPDPDATQLDRRDDSCRAV